MYSIHAIYTERSSAVVETSLLSRVIRGLNSLEEGYRPWEEDNQTMWLSQS